jgi:hypothetical protein
MGAEGEGTAGVAGPGTDVGEEVGAGAAAVARPELPAVHPVVRADEEPAAHDQSVRVRAALAGAEVQEELGPGGGAVGTPELGATPGGLGREVDLAAQGSVRLADLRHVRRRRAVEVLHQVGGLGMGREPPGQQEENDGGSAETSGTAVLPRHGSLPLLAMPL